MNSNTKKFVFLGALGLVLVFVLYKQIFAMTPEQEAYMANAAASATQQQSAPAAPQGENAPAGAPAGPTSSFITAGVNLEELLARIEDETFNYDIEREQRDPMRPLLGPDAPQALPDGMEEASGGAASMDIAAVLRLRVTGIIYDSAHPLAVVNQQVVAQGEELLPGVVVDAIESDRVLVRVQNTLVPLEINANR